tara:strand:+ start:134 stop:475 length:342 start_codon:yes stop_codon:yes gene_type:complete
MIVKVVYHRDYGGFELSRQAVEWLAKRGHPAAIKYLKDNPERTDRGWLWPPYWELPRHDPLLVQVVEELGKDAGSCLVVEEIGGDRYYITEHDGLETLYTPEMDVWVVVEENT